MCSVHRTHQTTTGFPWVRWVSMSTHSSSGLSRPSFLPGSGSLCLRASSRPSSPSFSSSTPCGSGPHPIPSSKVSVYGFSFAFAPLISCPTARRVVAQLLAHEPALLHALASVLAIHVCIAVPWPFEPDFLKREFTRCIAFMFGTAFLLGLFQSTTDRGPVHPARPYLLSQYPRFPPPRTSNASSMSRKFSLNSSGICDGRTKTCTVGWYGRDSAMCVDDLW